MTSRLCLVPQSGRLIARTDDDRDLGARGDLTDLDLDTTKDCLVFEFRTKNYLGVCTGSFKAPAFEPKNTPTFAIHEKLDGPQIVSISRHISLGGADIISSERQGNAVRGSSRVVIGDGYELVIRMPREYLPACAAFDGLLAKIRVSGELVRVGCHPCRR